MSTVKNMLAKLHGSRRSEAASGEFREVYVCNFTKSISRHFLEPSTLESAS